MEEEEELEPDYANVVSGEALEELAKQGFRRMGIIHIFDMEWPCGHKGDAVEIANYGNIGLGSLKACSQCAEKYHL